GASQTLIEATNTSLELIINHLATKEIRKALQHFEFDLLIKFDSEKELSYYQLLGFIRGIELAGKTAQDFIVKTTFQVAEQKPELAAKLSPEILVDKLNQEKVFYRILWNLLRIGTSQVSKQVKPELVYALAEAFFEIGLKQIDIEHKQAVSTTDILHWKERIENCIIKYLSLVINLVELELKDQVTSSIRAKIVPEFKKLKINNTIKEQALELLESFNPGDYEQIKPIELLHSGLTGFNLKVMAEKKAMKDLGQIITTILDDNDLKSIITLQKEINKFAREVRDVSKDFLDLLREISQFLKKIEYGDSKVSEYFAMLMQKLRKKNYHELATILSDLNKAFVKE
ncbi:MAG: hypothetical protein ACTSQB_02595, partial [Candidatus Heimdallarchaeota archaeon]